MVKKWQWFCGWGGFISQTKGRVGFGWFWLDFDQIVIEIVLWKNIVLGEKNIGKKWFNENIW